MKLPDEIQATVKYFSNDDVDMWERIVRDCARVVFDPRHDDRKSSPVSYGDSRAILARYGLAPQEKQR